MSTLKQKLEYINETKKQIGNAIKSKGGSVTDNFREYATAITNLPSGGGGTSYDFSVLGYETAPDTDLQKYIDYSEQVKNKWDPNTTNLYNKFKNDNMMKFFPVVDFTNVFTAGYTFNGSSIQYFPKISSPSLTSTGSMFEECYLLEEFGGLDTSKVTDFSYMFNLCKSLKGSITLDTSSALKVSNMFQSCSRLSEVNFIGDTSKIKEWAWCFSNCNNITKVPVIDLSSCDYNTNPISYMFIGCKKLQLIEFKSKKIYSALCFTKGDVFSDMGPTGKVILHGSTDIFSDAIASTIKNQLPSGWTVEFDRSYVYQ